MPNTTENDRISPEVRTTAGVVRGRWENGVSVFRGIPYAEPPVGARRFAAPVPAGSWDGTRDATAFGPSVPQAGHPGAVMSSVSGAVGDGSAQCLTLNVWSPELGGARLPAMVWIQGGTYLENHTDNPHYDAATLAGCGAALVSVNYRVGADGFAHIAGAPANRGILDQIAALRWVRDNIAAFGGDPDVVTVFGQSAGAACIAALLVAPSAAGLFGRAICQSMPGTYFSERLAAAISASIAGELGVRATVADLARLPPRAVTDATAAVIARMPELVASWGPMALTPTPFSPVVDGVLLPDAPWRALAGGFRGHRGSGVGALRSARARHSRVRHRDDRRALSRGTVAPPLVRTSVRHAGPAARTPPHDVISLLGTRLAWHPAHPAPGLPGTPRGRPGPHRESRSDRGCSVADHRRRRDRPQRSASVKRMMPRRSWASWISR